MRSSTSTGGLYEGIVANLSDSDVVRCHPFGFVKAPQDFCIVPIGQTRWATSKHGFNVKPVGELVLRTSSSSFLLKGRAQHSTASRASNMAISVL